MDMMDTKSPPHRQHTWSRRRKLICLLPILVLGILALALGLGLGLTLGRADDESNNDDTAPPLPSPTSLWTPEVSLTWQIVLLRPLDLSSSSATTPDVSVFDIDLFDTPASTIQQLHSLGKKVLCYFSAGSYENWRSDADEFEDADLGNDLDGWPGEKWLDINSENVRRIMKTRIELAAGKGCDGVDPDNLDGYLNDNGVELTSEDSISYMSFLSNLTLPLNLALGLKNAGDIVPSVLPIVHFAVNEQCIEYSQCATYAPFIEAGKPVFHIEYPDGAGAEQGLKNDVLGESCGREGKGEGSEGFSTVLKKMELDGWVEYCDGSVEVTDVHEAVRGQD